MTEYMIHYNGVSDEEIAGFPTRYNASDLPITLGAPALRPDSTFNGWIADGETNPILLYLIEEGTSGDLVFTVDWILHNSDQAQLSAILGLIPAEFSYQGTGEDGDYADMIEGDKISAELQEIFKKHLDENVIEKLCVEVKIDFDTEEGSDDRSFVSWDFSVTVIYKVEGGEISDSVTVKGIYYYFKDNDLLMQYTAIHTPGEGRASD